MSKVFITDYIKNPSIEKKILGKYLSLKKNKNIEVLLVWHEHINKEFCKPFKNLKGVIRYGVGYDNIDVDYLNKKNILFCNTPDYGVDEVSDTAIAAILNFNRMINIYDINLKNKKSKYFNEWQENTLKSIKRINKVNIGVIGAGRIGTSVLKKCKYLGFNCSFYDPYLPSGFEKTINVKRVDSLKKLLNISDYVSLHIPLNKNTKNIINEEFILNMKKGSSLINTARGGLLKNLEIIYDALKNNQLQSIFLDVLPKEPPLLNNKLLKAWINNEKWILGRLIINPHSSYFSKEAFKEMRLKASLNALKIINNEKPINIIK
ncbi:hypothetical protein OA855_01835 [Pelagibacteraceae bacterium]|nr:hypothetical protein [Pelagibacteraceae bacterium]